VTKQLPHNGREFEYRIKSSSEEHERVAGESELNRSRCSGARRRRGRSRRGRSSPLASGGSAGFRPAPVQVLRPRNFSAVCEIEVMRKAKI
jgi:hypothetical protein